ncbi:MAG: class I SAM-dependent methyltransferase [Promethearchaeota archaeon]
MCEYYGIGAVFYDYQATGLNGDIQFYVEEAQKAGSPVLELGCGTGRILIPIAKADIDIVGLDYSPDMLSIARQKISKLIPETKKRIQLVEGDMRNFSFDQRFKLIMIPYRAFLHMMTPKDQRQALQCVHEHLTDDGRLVFNIFDPRLDIIAAHFGSLGSSLKKVNEFTNPETKNRVVVWDTRQYDPELQKIDQYFIFEELNQEGTVVFKNYSHMTLRYVYRYEMQYLLELCGYEIEALYGDFQRGSFRYGGEQVWIARKR